MFSKFNIIFEQVMDLLTESRRDDYIQQIKVKLPNEDPEALSDFLMAYNNPKKEKAALFWLLKKTIKLPEDQQKVDEAFNLIEKQHLDYQKFEKPENVIERDDKSTVRINQFQQYDPAKEPAFSNPYYAGDGVVIYRVETMAKED